MESHDILDSNLFEEPQGGEQEGVPIEITTQNRFILFHMLSFGLYSIWYMYYIWDFFKRRHRADVMPFFRAIFGIFFFYAMCEKIKRFARHKSYVGDYSSELLIGGFILFGVLNYLPDPFGLVSIFSFVLFLQPLEAFNFAISNSKEYRAITKTDFSGLQIVLMIFGVLFWMLVILSFFLPDPESGMYDF